MGLQNTILSFLNHNIIVELQSGKEVPRHSMTFEFSILTEAFQSVFNREHKVKSSFTIQ